jgi:hypothetical protein
LRDRIARHRIARDHLGALSAFAGFRRGMRHWRNLIFSAARQKCNDGCHNGDRPDRTKGRNYQHKPLGRLWGELWRLGMEIAHRYASLT